MAKNRDTGGEELAQETPQELTQELASAEPLPLAESSAALPATGELIGAGELIDVDELIAARGLPGWQGAALRRYAGWAPGKAVTETDFETALEGLAKRPMGGGR